MKAICYGPSKSLVLTEVEKPVPADDEVSIEVHAASVNPLDGHILSANKLVRSLMFKMIGSRVNRPGVDVAGVVEAVGRNVTSFVPGDFVFGSTAGGAFAEYTCSRESRLAKMPASLNFESAATLSVAGLTALQGLRDIAGLGAGQKVLVNGASGGVGTFAVQIAKWLGADVTGVCSTRNLDLVRGIGADRMIDYTRDDFANSDELYDVIFDLVDDKPLSVVRRILTDEGKWIGAGVLGADPSVLSILPGMLTAAALSAIGTKKFRSFIAKPSEDDLVTLAELVENGTIKPIIDRTFGLGAVPEAVAYVARKHARGKVLISLDKSVNRR